MPFDDQLYFKSPHTVRKAMLSLIAGWISLLAFIYHINAISPGKIHINLNVRVAIVGLVICFFVFKIKPWARILCIFINIAAIGINALFVVPFFSASQVTYPSLVLHALGNVVLFAVCTYFLLAAPTAVFFRAQIPPRKEKDNSAN